MSYYFLKQENSDFLLQEIASKIALENISYTVTNKSLKYTVFYTPTAIEKNLEYTILLHPASIDIYLQYTVFTTKTPEKDLKYCILTIPVATEKDLEYKVQATPAAIEKDLTYIVLSTVPAIEKSLKYTVFSTVAATEKNLKYEIVSIPSAIEKGMKYTVTSTVSAIEKDLEYTIKVTPSAIEKSLIYEVLNVPSAIEISLQYTVFSTVAAIEKDLEYFIAVSPIPQKSLKYTVFSTVTPIEKSLSYSVPTSLILTKTLIYKVLATYSDKTKFLKYEIKTIPTAIGKSLKYCIITTTRPNEFNSLVPAYLPKAYYRFSSGAMTVDSSGNSHTLTAIAYPTDGTPKFGGSVGFGLDNLFTIVNHADFRPTGNFSISTWMKVAYPGVNQWIFQSYSQNPNMAGIQLYVTTANKIALISAKNTGVTADVDYKLLTSTNSVADGNWHFITATWDGAKLHLYIDGAEEGTGVAWTNAPAYAATNYVRIGCRNGAGSNQFAFLGLVDDFAFWNGKALSAGEVTTLNTTELNASLTLLADSALKAYYRFENKFLNTDTTINTHTLTPVNYPIGLTTKFAGLVFLGSSSAYSVVDHTDFKPTGSFTIGSWVKTAETGSARYIFQSFSQNTNFAGFYLRRSAGNKTYFVIGKNTGTTLGVDYQAITGGTTISDGNWHFIVATYDGSYLNLYVDGVSDATHVAWANAPVYATTNYVRIGAGCLAGSNSSYFNGTLDDMFLLNGKALTLAEVNNIYTVYSIGLKYSVAGTPTAKIKSLKYTVLKPTAPTKFLKYTVRTTPTAPTKSLKYTVFTSPIAVGKSLKYTILITVTAIDKGLKYEVITIPFIEKDLTYEVLSVPTAIDKSLKYTIFTTLPAIDKSLIYSVKTVPTAINKSLKYIVYSTVPAIDKSLKYTILITLPKIDKSLLYQVTTIPTAITKPLKYCIIYTNGWINGFLLQENGDLILQENGGRIIFCTPNWVNYFLLQENGDYLLQENGGRIILDRFIDTSIDLTYCIFQHTAAKTKTLKYTVWATAGALTKSLIYTIVITPSSLSKSLTYDVVAPPAAITKSLKYEVLTFLALTKSLKYTVITTPSAKTESLKYTVVSTPPALLKSLKYAVITTAPRKKKRLDYRILLDSERTELYHPQNITYTYYYRSEEYVMIWKSLTYAVV